MALNKRTNKYSALCRGHIRVIRTWQIHLQLKKVKRTTIDKSERCNQIGQQQSYVCTLYKWSLTIDYWTLIIDHWSLIIDHWSVRIDLWTSEHYKIHKVRLSCTLTSFSIFVSVFCEAGSFIILTTFSIDSYFLTINWLCNFIDH